MTPDALAKTHAVCFPPTLAWDAARFQTYLARDTTVITGSADSFVLGTLLLDEAEILTIATNPMQRQRGLARAALRDFTDRCAKRGAAKVFLEVAADNAPAIALYVSAGFAQVGLRQKYYQRADGTHCDALVLQLDLPQR
ncbi:ribosomal-protein-alanine N-acetyltransferase [Cognatiyoonia koreensis]|uniref:Ribosomal-protein-alanine N-acetyltransferase n=1 Tax=Cognatiyoonia koreensis TaxID=364200 RepID=A0A1I0QLB4_9RHOB|nr:GNAT family N-acetyltransferase [Cognatiyoonia koreensis]SEW28083.1 ribosomal-protein-alanine N-acetyltransferase [Cognatiyoonia koreensis]